MLHTHTHTYIHTYMINNVQDNEKQIWNEQKLVDKKTHTHTHIEVVLETKEMQQIQK